jgi:hypothetical protein
VGQNVTHRWVFGTSRGHILPIFCLEGNDILKILLFLLEFNVEFGWRVEIVKKLKDGDPKLTLVKV